MYVSELEHAITVVARRRKRIVFTWFIT